MKSYARRLIPLLVCALTLGLVACDDGWRPIASSSDAAGEYAYEYKGGPVEVVTLRENLTFRQELYADLATYKAYGTPKYTLEGVWSYEEVKITFKPFLTFCNYPDPNTLLKTPEKYIRRTGTWIAPYKEQKGAISFYADKGYIAVRVTNRSSL